VKLLLLGMLNQGKIIGLPVYTQSGIFLGKIIKIETMADQRVIKYFVQTANPLKNLLAGQLIISVEQVISLDEEKMVVEDSLKKIIDPSPIPSV